MPRESFLQRFCSYANSGTTTGRISSAAPALTAMPRGLSSPMTMIIDDFFTPEEEAWGILVHKGYTRLFQNRHDMLQRAEDGELLAQTLKLWYETELVALRLKA